MTRAAADALLLELGDRMGLPGLHLDRNGCCRLAFDGRWLVTVAFMPGARLFLHCPIGAPATAESLDAAVMLTMLQGSFMGRGAAGATLAVGPDRRPCVQRDLAVTGSDLSDLHGALEQLLNTAETWSARLLAPAPVSISLKTRPSPFRKAMA
jgi:hypothetical protein